MGRISPNKPAASCVGCFAWGVLPGRYCRACYTFGQLHQVGACAACRRDIPIKKGYCRLCWLQASLEAKGQVTVLEPFLRRLTCQQLFFTRMHRIRQPGPLLGKAGRRARRSRPALVDLDEPATGGTQLRLTINTRRDYASFSRREHADLHNPALVRARQLACSIGEARGWTPTVAGYVDRALVILLSGHADGDTIRFSELFPVLRRYGLSVERTIEVLDHLGLFDDDRIPAFESWLERKLVDLAPGIRRDAEDWLRTLRDGGPRSRPRSQASSSLPTSTRSARCWWTGRHATTISARSPATTSWRSASRCTAANATTPSASSGRCFATARRPGPSSATRPPGSESAANPTACSFHCDPRRSARPPPQRPPQRPRPPPAWPRSGRGARRPPQGHPAAPAQ